MSEKAAQQLTTFNDESKDETQHVEEIPSGHVKLIVSTCVMRAISSLFLGRKPGTSRRGGQGHSVLHVLDLGRGHRRVPLWLR